MDVARIFVEGVAEVRVGSWFKIINGSGTSC